MDSYHEHHDRDETEEDQAMDERSLGFHSMNGATEDTPVGNIPKQEDFSMDQENLNIGAHRVENDVELLGAPNSQRDSPSESKPVIPTLTPPAPEPDSKPSVGAKPNYKHQYTLSGHKLSISSLKFSPSGAILASSGVFA